MKKPYFPKLRYVVFALFCALAVQSYNAPALYAEQVETLADGATITTKKDGTKHLVLSDSVPLLYDSVPFIRIRAFQDNQLTSVVIPDSVTLIGALAFANNKLTSVSIPPSVTSMGALAFSDNQLTEVILSKTLYSKTNIVNAFNHNPAGLKFYEYDASKPGNKGRKLN